MKETILMAGSPIGDEFVGESRQKKLPVARGFDGGGDFQQLHDG